MTGLADFHDGYVDGVLLSPTDVRILLRTVEGKRFTLLLNGIEALQVNDLKEGNIIFEVKVLELAELDSSFIFEVYGYSDYLKKTFVLNEWLDKAVQKGLKGIEITPSHGCTVLATFKDYSLIEGLLGS
jgi:hypothetical protein